APPRRRRVAAPGLGGASGSGGGARARARYSWDRIAIDVLRVYEKALGDKAPAGAVVPADAAASPV
ncbi:glycosyltransferase family 1 protein, partial [Amycolatopsis thermoflava]